MEIFFTSAPYIINGLPSRYYINMVDTIKQRLRSGIIYVNKSNNLFENNRKREEHISLS